jgi:NAD(P)-dependent dehydrogenase (short-subunit alcohol dehydrogenase family)
MQLDVGSEQSIDDAVSSTAKKFGSIDYAVNNAGIAGPLVRSAEHSMADWQKVMDVNLNGVWMSQRAEIRQMLKQKAGDTYRTGRGVIINLSSMYGVIATSMNTPAVAYTTSKHAVVGMALAHSTKVNANNSRRHDKSRRNCICSRWNTHQLDQSRICRHAAFGVRFGI